MGWKTVAVRSCVLALMVVSAGAVAVPALQGGEKLADASVGVDVVLNVDCNLVSAAATPQEIRCTYTITNVGDAASDTGVYFSSGGTESTWSAIEQTNGWNCTQLGHIECTYPGPLAPGATTPPVVARATVNPFRPCPVVAAIVTDLASAADSGSGGHGNWVMTNVDVPCPVDPAAAADLRITKTAPPLGVANTAASATGITNTAAQAATADTAAQAATANNAAQAIAYTITVSNAGPATAHSEITVTDNLPAEVNFAGANSDVFACTYIEVPHRVVCTSSVEMEPGASATITVLVTLAAPCTTLVNTATVASDDDPNLSNNVATATLTCPGSGPIEPDIALDKVVAPTQGVRSGDPIGYTLTVTDVGADPYTGALTVVDVLPANVIYDDATGDGWTCVAAVAPDTPTTVTCQSPEQDAAGPITIRTHRSASPCATVTNSATVTGPTQEPAANNSASATFTCLDPDPGPPGDLTIDKVGPTTPIQQGQEVSYELTVSNLDDVAYPGNITVTDVVPDELTPLFAQGEGWTCDITGQTATCTRPGPGAPGALDPITIAARRRPVVCQRVTNVADVSGTSAEFNTENNSDEATTACSGIDPWPADLTVTKTANASFAGPGAPITYTIDVDDLAPTGVPWPGPVYVLDTLPIEFTYVAGSGTNWTCDYDDASHEVLCTHDGGGVADHPLTITGSRTTAACGGLLNLVHVSIPEQFDETNYANNDGGANVICTKATPAPPNGACGQERRCGRHRS